MTTLSRSVLPPRLYSCVALDRNNDRGDTTQLVEEHSGFLGWVDGATKKLSDGRTLRVCAVSKPLPEEDFPMRTCSEEEEGGIIMRAGGEANEDERVVEVFADVPCPIPLLEVVHEDKTSASISKDQDHYRSSSFGPAPDDPRLQLRNYLQYNDFYRDDLLLPPAHIFLHRVGFLNLGNQSSRLHIDTLDNEALGQVNRIKSALRQRAAATASHTIITTSNSGIYFAEVASRESNRFDARLITGIPIDTRQMIKADFVQLPERGPEAPVAGPDPESAGSSAAANQEHVQFSAVRQAAQAGPWVGTVVNQLLMPTSYDGCGTSQFAAGSSTVQTAGSLFSGRVSCDVSVLYMANCGDQAWHADGPHIGRSCTCSAVADHSAVEKPHHDHGINGDVHDQNEQVVPIAEDDHHEYDSDTQEQDPELDQNLPLSRNHEEKEPQQHDILRTSSPLFRENDDHSPAYGLCVFLALTDNEPGMGGTEFWPGSHKHPGLLGLGPLGPLVEATVTTKNARRGDCVLYDYRLLHRGLANETPKERRMLQFFYYRSDLYREVRNYGTQSLFESETITSTDEL
ncbi:unnamed protein product [Amoebophrya sp. A120]|nr:unnamed protein product [Amoebophrya sp. A120]|eukprot:GSA120T00001416001.1